MHMSRKQFTKNGTKKGHNLPNVTLLHFINGKVVYFLNFEVNSNHGLHSWKCVKGSSFDFC